jgi:8-oxo-dGTP diphosphatase
MKRVEAAVALIERNDGKILVVWDKRYGRWGWPGGKVEEDETPLEAMRREVREEVGCLVQEAALVHEGPHGESVESTRGSYVYVFRVKLWETTTPQEQEEGCAVTWFTREEFLKWGIAPAFYEKFFAKEAK